MNILNKVFELEKENKGTYRKIKKDLALTLIIEECSELIQAIAKYESSEKQNLDNVHEEIADVIIMFSVLVTKLNIRKVDILGWGVICKKPTLIGSINKLALLQQVVSKHIRGKGVAENIYTAIAGVITSLHFIIYNLELNIPMIETWIMFKVNRTQQRIEDNTFK